MDTIPEMTQYITNFRLNDRADDNPSFTRVLLQLFGFLGHGKSSFINSCKYVLDDGEFNAYADVTKTDGGNTTARITYPLTGTLTLVDNRGCSVMNSYETGEIYAQLGNLLPLDKKVEWNKEFGLVDRIVQAEKSVQSSDFIFPIFVYSVKKGMSGSEVPEIKELLNTARDLTGIFPVVVLTHKTHPNLREVMKKFEDMGVEQIFALENFTPEDNLKTRGRHEDILKFFLEVIKDIKFRLERFKNPEEEREKRKKFVLKYVYDREMKKKDEQLEELKRQARAQQSSSSSSSSSSRGSGESSCALM